VFAAVPLIKSKGGYYKNDPEIVKYNEEIDAELKQKNSEIEKYNEETNKMIKTRKEAKIRETELFNKYRNTTVKIQ